jgi:hypothetical protein
MQKETKCESCGYLNEEPTPCECKKGHGKVSYIRPSCADYRAKRRNRDDGKTSGAAFGL